MFLKVNKWFLFIFILELKRNSFFIFIFFLLFSQYDFLTPFFKFFLGRTVGKNGRSCIYGLVIIVPHGSVCNLSKVLHIQRISSYIVYCVLFFFVFQRTHYWIIQGEKRTFLYIYGIICVAYTCKKNMNVSSSSH